MHKPNGKGRLNHPLHGKYAGFDRRAVKCFMWMQDRCRLHERQCDFTRSREGMQAFMDEIGPIPDTIKRPSVGRKDHAKGYVKGNLVWQPHSYNAWLGRRNEQDLTSTPLMAVAGVAAPQKWTKDEEDWDLG